MKKLEFAPEKVFASILEYTVIATFDLVIEYGGMGVILVKRSIAPYKNQWALPGLRIMKPESFRDTLKRIAKDELGLTIDPRKATILGQFDGKFQTEHNRQDISTGYCVRVPANQKIVLNDKHFSEMKIIKNRTEIPKNIGAMYRHYLAQYFKNKL